MKKISQEAAKELYKMCKRFEVVWVKTVETREVDWTAMLDIALDIKFAIQKVEDEIGVHKL